MPIEISGSFGSFTAVFAMLGNTLTYLSQYIVLNIITNYEEKYESYWRVVFSFPMPFIIIQFLMLIFVYDFETPKYLLQQKREEECIVLLKRIYKPEYVDGVLT